MMVVGWDGVGPRTRRDGRVYYTASASGNTYGGGCIERVGPRTCRDGRDYYSASSSGNTYVGGCTERVGGVANSGGWKPLSPRERGPMRWTDSTLGLNGGSSGREVIDPSGWLTAYWMGRYYGFIEPPAAKDPELISVKARDLHVGAKPYDGQSRPQ